jgi:hypothetical protein
MADATTTIALGDVTLPTDQATMLQAAADIANSTVGVLLQAGRSVQSIVNDTAVQSVLRLAQAGSIPSDVLAETKAYAAKQVAARGGAA